MAVHPRDIQVPKAQILAASENVPLPVEWQELSGLGPKASTADLLRRGARRLAASKGWALRRREWERYLDLHGHADLLCALLRLPLDDIDGATYWQLMENVWTRADNFTDRPVWRALLSRHPEHRTAMMSDGESAKLACLPERIALWRGVSDAEHAKGFSWTLSRRRGHWFAKRFAFAGSSPTLLGGAVARSDVIAFLNGRKEQEIIAFPESVEIVSVSWLRPREA